MDLRGCRVEASSRRDFHTADTLAQVDRVNPALGWTELELSAPGAYRYWRISKRGGFVPLAEVRFYNQSELLTGVPFQAEGVPSGQAFDGDVLTFEYYPSWIGLDFGHDVPVTRIRLLPRTDDNGINAGEVYELYYYGAEGWQSLGTQVATSAELEFPKVPAHALYWLRNLQRGQEERIFVLERREGHFSVRYGSLLVVSNEDRALPSKAFWRCCHIVTYCLNMTGAFFSFARAF